MTADRLAADLRARWHRDRARDLRAAGQTLAAGWHERDAARIGGAR